MDQLPDPILLVIQSFLLDPADRTRLAACSRDLRPVLQTPPPLRIRIVGYGNTALAETFYVSRAQDLWNAQRLLVHTEHLHLGVHYHFWLARNNKPFCLGRYRRISDEGPTSLPHKSCRFSLGLSASRKKLQTWTVSHLESDRGCFSSSFEGGIVIPWNQPVGLSVGGKDANLFLPQNRERRVLTSRRGDWNVVVNWWGGHEKTRLIRASDAKAIVSEPRLPLDTN